MLIKVLGRGDRISARKKKLRGREGLEFGLATEGRILSVPMNLKQNRLYIHVVEPGVGIEPPVRWRHHPNTTRSRDKSRTFPFFLRRNSRVSSRMEEITGFTFAQLFSWAVNTNSFVKLGMDKF